MAEFGGAVYCSTLPSGRIYAYQAGVAQWPPRLAARVAARRGGEAQRQATPAGERQASR